MCSEGSEPTGGQEPAEEQKPSTKHLRLFYETAVKMHEREGNWYWQRWSAFLAANTFLATGTAVLLKISDVEVFISVAALFGMVLCFLWYLVNVQTAAYRRKWVDQAHELERFLLGGDFGSFTRGAQAIEALRGRDIDFEFRYPRSQPDRPTLPAWWCLIRLQDWSAGSITAWGVPWLLLLAWFVILFVAYWEVGLAFVFVVALLVLRLRVR